MSDRLEETKPDIKLIRALQADFKALYQPKYTANHKTKQMLINIELGIMQLKNLQSYIDSKIIEARLDELQKLNDWTINGMKTVDDICMHLDQKIYVLDGRIKALNHRKDDR